MKNSKITDRKLLIIILGLLVLLFAQNIYLQVKVNEAVDYASDASYNASNAEYEAREAKDYAEDAADNAFGNNCNYCP